MREVARRAGGREFNARWINFRYRVRSLPQSASLTAPSSEGAQKTVLTEWHCNRLPVLRGGLLFHVKRRRNGLHIIRVRASANAHSFRRFSSPTQTRFAGLWVGFCTLAGGGCSALGRAFDWFRNQKTHPASAYRGATASNPAKKPVKYRRAAAGGRKKHIPVFCPRRTGLGVPSCATLRVRARRPGDFGVLFIPEKYLARGRNIPSPFKNPKYTILKDNKTVEIKR